MAQFGWKKGETRHRARESIMHYVLEFCITRAWRDRNTPSGQGFTPSGYDSTSKVQVGDLVILESTRTWSKWQIGWLRAIDGEPGWPIYVIESLEDGELCNWSNVSLAFFPRKDLADHRTWQWNDRQWAFWKRWERVCHKERDAYIVLPLLPEFGAGYSVTLGTRTRYGFDDLRPTRSFPDWRKVTKAMMRQCYDECVSEREAYLKTTPKEQPHEDK